MIEAMIPNMDATEPAAAAAPPARRPDYWLAAAIG
jgi:hypothetical protein